VWRQLGLALALAAIVLGGWLASAAPADEASVAGSWSGSIANDNGVFGDIELVVKQNGEAITGTLSNKLTGVKSPIVGTLKGTRLNFRVTSTGYDWEAVVAGNTLAGLAQRSGSVTGYFTAIKND
jgi:large exoprotein involved in heme utilization and adhesion